VVNTVVISARAQKDLRKCPTNIVGKLRRWIDAVQADGVAEVRKQSGYHDEPLHREREGQRSIRLSRLWRAIYVEGDGKVQCLEVIEVTPHKY
jgi:proteic killer suppression protein